MTKLRTRLSRSRIRSSRSFYFEHTTDDLVSKWDNEPFFVGGKRHNPFKIYSGSQLRTDVKRREFFPGSEPGAIIRFSPLHGIVMGENRYGDEYSHPKRFPGVSRSSR